VTGWNVLLLHGWAGSAETTWVGGGWISALEDAGRAPLAVDLLGHGTAPRPEDAASYADLAGDVLSRITPGREPFDVVGYSLGAKIGLEIARRLAGRVRRLVMLGAGDNVFGREAADAIVAAIHDPDDESLSDLARSLGIMARDSGNSPLALAACLRRPPNPTFTPGSLAAVTAEVTLIAGTDDEAFGGHRRLASSLARVNAAMVDGVDHVGTPESGQVRSLAVSALAEQSGREIWKPR
jgi:pimeloyl-ACP methyl ester carboxylesterase